MLIDYPSHARWNSFMREASGKVAVGKKLNITNAEAWDAEGQNTPNSAVARFGQDGLPF